MYLRSAGFHQPVIYTTLGFRPSCDCYDATPWPFSRSLTPERLDPDQVEIALPILEEYKMLEKAPPIVADIFAGSGTTLLVARQLGRHAVGTDLSFAYLHDQARGRLSLDALEEWQTGGKDGKGDLSELPLFAEMEEG